MNTTHPAEEYLRNPENPHNIRVVINGKIRKLFVNDKENDPIGITLIGKKKRGIIFYEWDRIDKVLYPQNKSNLSSVQINKKLILKYKKLAAEATFTNSWLRHIAEADLNKDLYENHITSGTSIDGKCIKIETLRKYFGDAVVTKFLNAVKNKEEFDSGRYPFQGYDGTLWVHPIGEDVQAGLNKEYKNCGNGYYYLLINEKQFIGYDID